MTDEERSHLEYAAEVLGLTKTAVIQKGVELMYAKARKQAEQ